MMFCINTSVSNLIIFIFPSSVCVVVVIIISNIIYQMHYIVKLP